MVVFIWPFVYGQSSSVDNLKSWMIRFALDEMEYNVLTSDQIKLMKWNKYLIASSLIYS